MKSLFSRNKFRLGSFVLVMIFLFTTINVFAIDGVYHAPYGIYDLYEIQATERSPRDPVAGENVYVKITTWPIEMGQATWLTWTKNGVAQPDIGGSWQYNSGNNSYWQASMGSFNKGDVISYTVHANKDGANEKTVGPFQFTVTSWEYITSVSGYTNYNNHVVIDAVPNTGTMTPKINIVFTADDVFRVQMSPTGNGLTTTGLSNYTVTSDTSTITMSTSAMKVKVQKNPFRITVLKPDGTTVISQQYDSTVNRSMAWLTNGSTIINKVEDHFYTPSTEEFYGFGEHYNNFRKRGYDIDTYVYNQYQNQNEKTYMAIPFFVSTKGYGIYLNSTYYSKFRMATERSDMYSFTSDTSGSSGSILDYYFIYGSNVKDVISNYTDITGKPQMVPKWALGLWMSANEWDRQSEVTAAVDNANANNIPATAVVLEQWSDESTFYIFNDATYTPKSGIQSFAYSDFTFGTKWPNPKNMADYIHNNGMKLVLWQVPIQKYMTYPYTQKDNDESYMISQGYAVGNGSGGQYRIPWGQWFENSLLLDFTNTNAKNWWMSKRAYLFDGVGIDGFKTDGGEMVWGKDVTFSNGKKGDEMRNYYPNEYIKGYNDYARSKNANAYSFSRSGTAGAQLYGGYWSGDQSSTFTSYQQSVMAGLTANISGVPFWGWDLSGFTGNFPTAELYKRSTEMAAFCPIMQFHSEKSAPTVSEERSPWNVQARTGDNTVISTFAKYANVRMNLLPYIYSEATKASTTGIPLMRAMPIEYPDDTNTYGLTSQYMFGDNLLVAPIVNEGETNKSVYLPAGEWIDFWWGAQKPGGRTITYGTTVNDIPVFVKAGAIIPMNLNSQYELGGTIGNSLTSYNNLTFRVYPSGTTSYSWNDDIGGSIKTITSTEQYSSGTETVSLPPVTSNPTLQVYTTKPTSVTAAGTGLTEYTSLSAFISATQGWYYDSVQKFTYVKVPASTSTRSIALNGVNKVEYEAEFATLNGTTTNTNHTGYSGTGFVDGFETLGDYVQFDISAKTTGNKTLAIKYCSAGGNASRAIYVNGVKVQDVTLPQTANWDTWGTVTVTIPVNAGNNTVKVSYDSTSSLGINLDNIALRE